MVLSTQNIGDDNACEALIESHASHPSWSFHLSEDLRQKLIELGSSSQLLTVGPGEDCDLYLEHKIVDAKYYGVASKETVKKRYVAKIWLVEPERIVKYREIIEEQSGSAGVLPAPKLSAEKTFFKGKVLFKKEKEVAFGFKKPADPTSFGKVYEYDFDIRKVRDPVKQLAEANGWKFEQIITDYQPSSKKSAYCTECGAVVESGTKFCAKCGKSIA
jgi:hypothetical protein